MEFGLGFPHPEIWQGFLWLGWVVLSRAQKFTDLEMKFCEPLRKEHQNAINSTETLNFLCSNQFLCSHNDWPKFYMPHFKIRDRSLLLHTLLHQK